jgi:hypothetical protein
MHSAIFVALGAIALFYVRRWVIAIRATDRGSDRRFDLPSPLESLLAGGDRRDLCGGRDAALGVPRGAGAGVGDPIPRWMSSISATAVVPFTNRLAASHR